MTGKVPEECRSCRGECLKNVEFLVGLPPEKVTTLLRRAVRLTLPKGKPVTPSTSSTGAG